MRTKVRNRKTVVNCCFQQYVDIVSRVAGLNTIYFQTGLHALMTLMSPARQQQSGDTKTIAAGVGETLLILLVFRITENYR